MSIGPVVSDNSPLVGLFNLNLLSLFRDLYTEVLIPRAVENEFLRWSPIARREALDNAPWIRVVDLQDPQNAGDGNRPSEGEAAALALADEKKARLVLLDDKKARKEAKERGFIVKGTVGVLLEAKEKRLIDKVEPHLIALKDSGVRLGESFIRLALEMAGEAD